MIIVDHAQPLPAVEGIYSNSEIPLSPWMPLNA